MNIEAVFYHCYIYSMCGMTHSLPLTAVFAFFAHLLYHAHTAFALSFTLFRAYNRR
jgi:hypothetical protein